MFNSLCEIVLISMTIVVYMSKLLKFVDLINELSYKRLLIVINK